MNGGEFSCSVFSSVSPSLRLIFTLAGAPARRDNIGFPALSTFTNSRGTSIGYQQDPLYALVLAICC